MTDVAPQLVAVQHIEEWIAVGLPHYCLCGHEHYGRIQFLNGKQTNLAPQYHICEDPDCDCTVLRQISNR